MVPRILFVRLNANFPTSGAEGYRQFSKLDLTPIHETHG